jgi:hypothetical protein
VSEISDDFVVVVVVEMVVDLNIADISSSSQ